MRNCSTKQDKVGTTHHLFSCPRWPFERCLSRRHGRRRPRTRRWLWCCLRVRRWGLDLRAPCAKRVTQPRPREEGKGAGVVPPGLSACSSSWRIAARELKEAVVTRLCDRQQRKIQHSCPAKKPCRACKRHSQSAKKEKKKKKELTWRGMRGGVEHCRVAALKNGLRAPTQRHSTASPALV